MYRLSSDYRDWKKKGSSIDFVSGFEDWLPTISELAGVNKDTMPSNLDGISLAPLLLGRKQAPRPYLYREFPSYGGQQSVRVREWKAIRKNMDSGNLEIELYNLDEDIGENNNVAALNPEILTKLRKIMESQHTPSEAFPLRSVDTSPTIEKFKAILSQYKRVVVNLSKSINNGWD